MSVFTHFWENLLRRFRPGAPLSAGEFERELSAARQERQSLLGQLNELQAEVESGISAGKREAEKPEASRRVRAGVGNPRVACDGLHGGLF